MSTGKAQKKMMREKSRQKLINMSAQRSSQAPNYGMREGELLQMKETVRQLVVSNNNQHDLLKDYESEKQRISQVFCMNQVLLKIIVDKGLSTVEEIDRLTREVQSAENGYSSKGPEAVAEMGDLLLISFTIYNAVGDVVDDRSKEILAYNLGQGGLTCDDKIVGIRKGETRHLTTVFGPGFVHKHLIGQELVLHLTCHDIQIKRK